MGIFQGTTMYVPWLRKITAKMLFSRLPIPYHVWKRPGVFSPGLMVDAAYAYAVFKLHFESAPFVRRTGFTHIELGPGNSLASALVGHAFYADQAYLIDVKDFVRKDLVTYVHLATFLRQKGLPSLKPDQIISIEGLLAMCHAHYATTGLKKLRMLPDASVDFIWSHSVLQHVKREEFYETLVELRRIIREDGACSHVVDLSDMLEGGLNNLRYPDAIWESRLMRNSGFYTNRLRHGEIVALCRDAGFNVTTVSVDRWNQLPTPQRKLASRFQTMPLEELLIRGGHIVLTPITKPMPT